MARKNDTAAAAVARLRTELKQGAVGGLYLLHGEEVYLRDHYISELKKALLPAGLEDFNLHILQGKTVTPRAIAEAVDCLPMMSERTLVLVYDYDIYRSAEARDALTALFAELPEYCCLVFVFDLIDYKPDARTKLAAALNRHGLVVELARQEQDDLTNWLRRRFHAEGHEIDAELCRYLIFLCGDLMTGLVGEVAKISAYSKHARITREDIDAVATPRLDAVVFQMADAVAAGQYDRAVAVLGDLLHMQEAPVMILSVLGRQLRQLYAARLALEHKKGSGWLVSVWGMRPYFAEKILQSARRLSLPWCRHALERAMDSDLAMKSTGMDERDVLVGLVLELAHHPVTAP